MRAVLSLVGFFLTAGVACAADVPRAKPNVLLSAIDDLNDWVGFLDGHPQIKTPHPYQRQSPVRIEYKESTVPNAYRIDVFVADLVVVELKSVNAIEPVHDAQLLTYLRLASRWLKLLVNFNMPILRDGIKCVF